jgi:NAD(P)-dependent dehydrogenase (short-subunit alcohol dehydrogenase family)
VVRAVELAQPGRLLAGQTVLVTGAGRNIGRATALACAEQGAQVIALDIDAQSAQATAALTGGIAVTADITDHTAVSEALGGLPQIDVLVNNVGIAGLPWVQNLDPDEWRMTYETNVIGPLWLTRLCVEKMRERGHGNVVFVSSIHQWLPRGDAAYALSKATIGSMVKELALELAPYGIRVNGVAPGTTLADEDGSPRADPRSTLHGTTVPPQYVGRAVVFLASDFFSLHTTGSTVTVDAGLSLLSQARLFPNP